MGDKGEKNKPGDPGSGDASADGMPKDAPVPFAYNPLLQPEENPLLPFTAAGPLLLARNAAPGSRTDFEQYRFNQMKDLVDHGVPQELEDVGEALWDAARAIRDAERELKTYFDEVDPDWEGETKEAFDAWGTQLRKEHSQAQRVCGHRGFAPQGRGHRAGDGPALDARAERGRGCGRRGRIRHREQGSRQVPEGRPQAQARPARTGEAELLLPGRAAEHEHGGEGPSCVRGAPERGNSAGASVSPPPRPRSRGWLWRCRPSHRPVQRGESLSRGIRPCAGAVRSRGRARDQQNRPGRADVSPERTDRSGEVRRDRHRQRPARSRGARRSVADATDQSAWHAAEWSSERSGRRAAWEPAARRTGGSADRPGCTPASWSSGSRHLWAATSLRAAADQYRADRADRAHRPCWASASDAAGSHEPGHHCAHRARRRTDGPPRARTPWTDGRSTGHGGSKRRWPWNGLRLRSRIAAWRGCGRYAEPLRCR